MTLFLLRRDGRTVRAFWSSHAQATRIMERLAARHPGSACTLSAWDARRGWEPFAEAYCHPFAEALYV